MPTTIVLDGKGGQKAMNLPDDFQERIICPQSEPLEPFLARNSPLAAHAAWIQVHGPQNRPNECPLLQSAISWIRNRGPQITEREVDAMALARGCLCGKWKIRVETAQLEHVWGLVARAVYGGTLRTDISSAKVSTLITQTARSRGSLHTIYVYLNNYLHEESVRHTRLALQKLLHDSSATLTHFKPDIYTYAGWSSDSMPLAVDRRAWFEPVCGACDKTDGDDLKRCTACQSIRYCNVTCQRAHWKLHKKLCKSLQNEKQQGAKLPATNNSEDGKKKKTDSVDTSATGDSKKRKATEPSGSGNKASTTSRSL